LDNPGLTPGLAGGEAAQVPLPPLNDQLVQAHRQGFTGI